MKSPRALCLLFLATLGGVRAQDTVSDLTVTLPSGKVVTFQTEEQKSRFLAARAAQASRVQPASTAPVNQHPAAKPDLGHSALDAKPPTNGKVNATAPTFTASYYMLAPETWTGKQITLSVAFLEPIHTTTERADGLQQMEALTYNNTQGGIFGQSSGGYLPVLAKPDVAVRLMQLCGTTYQYNGGQYRTTLIRGELRKADKLTHYYSSYSNSAETDVYAFYVDK